MNRWSILFSTVFHKPCYDPGMILNRSDCIIDDSDFLSGTWEKSKQTLNRIFDRIFICFVVAQFRIACSAQKMGKLTIEKKMNGNHSTSRQLWQTKPYRISLCPLAKQ